MFESYNHYDPFLSRRWIIPEKKPIRRQQTCPVCGRKLVNIYLRNGVWKCKKCWEGEGQS